MSPLAVSLDPAFVSRPLAAVASAPTPTVAVVSSGDAVVPRPLWLAIATMILALVVGGVFVAGALTFTRTVGEDIFERPDLAFAAGFVCLFGPLVAVALPLIVSTLLGGDGIAALAGVVSIPGLFLWGLVLVVAGCLGAVVVGERLAGRVTDSSSPVQALVAGAAFLGASQLVPVLGALVAMGLATVAVGAVARRQFDIDDRLFDLESDDRPRESTSRTAAARSGGARARASERSQSDPSWRTGDEPAETTTDRGRDVWTTDESERNGIDDGDDETWPVDGWEWDADENREADGDDEAGARREDTENERKW